MNSPSPDFFAILSVLAKHQVEFTVVGDVCGVFHGAPMTTYDLDILRSTTGENAGRMLQALEELDG